MAASPNSAIVVTSAGAAHFDLALELLDSLRSHSSLNSTAFGILDAGLTPAQKELLVSKKVFVATAKWEFESQPPTGMPIELLSMLSRPFLPKYFPTFDLIVSLDSDTWIQMASGITDLLVGAAQADIAIAPELHSSYSHLYNPQHPIRNELRGTYRAVYGDLPPIPADALVLNAGVFAARRDSQAWRLWAASLADGIARVRNEVTTDGKLLFSAWNTINRLIEQNALNHAFYQKGLTIYTMSALYNFICTLAKPMFDSDSYKLVEPSAPHAPIRIVHLTGLGKTATHVLDRNGQIHQRGLRLSEWREIVFSSPGARIT
jgi:hypothetical protein